MRTILEYCRALFGRLAPETARWHIEAHQFRIEARHGEHGKPTPEGMHRDGVDYVLVLLVDRRNIASGTTTIHDLDKRTLGSFTLTDPLDCGAGRRRALLPRRDAGRAREPGPARLSRRAGGDVQEES